MQSLKHGFRFIAASFKLGAKHPQLLLPWLVLAIGNLILSLIGFLPLAVVLVLLGTRISGLLLTGFLAAVLILGLVIWGEVTTLQTCSSFQAVTQEDSQKASINPILAHWLDSMLLSLAMPGIIAIRGLQQIFNQNAANPERAQRNAWLDAHYLLIPVISIENLKLAKAKERVKEIVISNLLRFSPSLIKVRLLGWGVLILLGVTGIALGLLIGFFLSSSWINGPWGCVLASLIGLLVFWLPFTLGMAFNTYVRACYHTALYQWMRRIETSRVAKETAKASPPEILRQVLEGKLPAEKEEDHAPKT